MADEREVHESEKYEEDPGGWWAISTSALLKLLHRAAAGEDVDMLYAEEYANAAHKYVEIEDDDDEDQ